MTHSQNHDAGNILIRRARNSDIETISQLEKEIFAEDAFSKKQILYLLGKANSTVLVIDEDKRTCGSAIMLWKINSSVGRLYSIGISSSHKGGGLGKQLLTSCEKEAKKRLCNSIQLEVRSDNSHAIEFYKKQGYEEVETLKGYYPNSDGIRMRKKL